MLIIGSINITTCATPVEVAKRVGCLRAWLTQAVEASDPHVRDQQLARWSGAPGALSCHPRSEHLLPLMVAAGAAGDDRGRRVFNDHIWGKAVSGFQFG